MYWSFSRIAPLPALLVTINLIHSGSCQSLADVLNAKTCFQDDDENDLKRAGEWKTSRTGFKWVLESNDWLSHRLVTTIAAILLKEHVGFDVLLNSVPTTARVYDRAAKKSKPSGAGESFGYINMEVWGAGKMKDAYEGLVVEYGSVGYPGRGGWFVAESFAQNLEFPLTPEFYRAYDTSASHSGPVIAALRQEYAVSCSSACYSKPAKDCVWPDKRTELQWCPTSSGSLPAILAYDPWFDSGFNPELAQSNGFQFAVRYLGKSYRQQAGVALSSGSAQIVWGWSPSVLLEQFKPIRVVLPSDHCGVHDPNGAGNWSCDFPSETLGKIASLEAKRDPVVNTLLKQFSIQEGGMQQMLRSLAGRMDSAGSNAAEAVFDTACSWILSNEQEVLGWIPSRKVPGFADTLLDEYPFATLFTAIAFALAYVLFLEIPWLGTTLSPVVYKKITATKTQWRHKLEHKLGTRAYTPKDHSSKTTLDISKDQSAKSVASRYETQETAAPAPPPNFDGLEARCVAIDDCRKFWSRAEAWHSEEAVREIPVAINEPPFPDAVHFAHHTFPAFQKSGSVSILLRRSEAGRNSGKSLSVEVVIEELQGGAKKGTDFEAGTRTVEFPAGSDQVVLIVGVKYHKDLWQNSYVFQARLSKVIDGEACLASPAAATVVVLDEDMYPGNIPNEKRGGYGLNLTWYYIKEGRQRRGPKWKITMMSMLYIPFHTGFVTILVQKLLVDGCARNLVEADNDADTMWLWIMIPVLVGVQFLSMGLARWADVNQTRNRGRTGGFRQDHRQKIFQKYLHLDQSEHWDASGNSWLYCAIMDVDSIVMNAYWQIFVLAQNVFALFMSFILVLGLMMWSNLQKSGDSQLGYSVDIVSVDLLPCLGALFLIVPLGLIGVFFRQKVTWVTVIARMQYEQKWVGLFAWLSMHGRRFYGLTQMERHAISKRWDSANAAFVRDHQVARNVMHDSSWITFWIQGLSYCLMLLFGIFAYIDTMRYGVGSMEVGTFYALIKIYMNVGKYIGKIGEVFVNMEKGVVSLRKMTALLNLTDQRSLRHSGKEWERQLVENRYMMTRGDDVVPASEPISPDIELISSEKREDIIPGQVHVRDGATNTALRTGSATARGSIISGCPRSRMRLQGAPGIIFHDDLSFIRPSHCKNGATFSELKLSTGFSLPIGSMIFASAKNEGVLCSFLGLAANIIHATNPYGDEVEEEDPRVVVPHGLRLMMIPTVPLGIDKIADTVLAELQLTGASAEFCTALIKCMGIEPTQDSAWLSPGCTQVVSIMKALLIDPDVLCMFRPLSLIPQDMQLKTAMLLRLWQAGGGAPRLAEFLDIPFSDGGVYRSSKRTLIVGNADTSKWNHFPLDVHLNLDDYLWSVGTASRNASDSHQDHDTRKSQKEKKLEEEDLRMRMAMDVLDGTSVAY